MSDNPGNPVTFQPGAQSQPGEIDTKAAAAAMALYGLDPAGEDAIEFARAYTQDEQRNDPQVRDRYARAARAAATSKRQQEAMARLGSLEDQRLANDRDALWRIANYKAAPIAQETKQVQSVLDTNDWGELWRMSQGKGNLSQDPNDSVNAEAWQRMAAAGIDLDEDDPEVNKQLDRSSPERFLASVDKIIQHKQQSRSIQDINDPAELFRIAKARGLL